MKMLRCPLFLISCCAFTSYIAVGQTSNSTEDSSAYTIKPVQPKVDFLTTLINQTNSLFVFPKDSLLFDVNRKEILRREEVINLSYRQVNPRLIIGQALISMPNDKLKRKND